MAILQLAHKTQSSTARDISEDNLLYTMGNEHSSAASRHLVDVELVSQTHEVVALPSSDLLVDSSSTTSPSVLANATRLRIEQLPQKDLSVFDYATGELLFRYDQKILSSDWTERMLVDAHNRPVVKMQKELVYDKNYFLTAPDTSDGSNGHKKQQKPCKLTSNIHHGVLKMELKLTDPKSGEKVAISVNGDWKLRKVVLWLTRGGGSKKTREPIGTIAWTPEAVGYDVSVASGMDLAIPALFTIVLHETVTEFPMFTSYSV